MDVAGRRTIEIVDYDPAWPVRFVTIGNALRDRLGDAAARIDHVGSTAVPGLAAKDLIDVQVTVADLEQANDWPDELLFGLTRRRGVTADHIPPGVTADSHQWTKLYWSDRSSLHVHVREDGRQKQRYALLFRDYLRADPIAAGAWRLKQVLAARAADDRDTYYAVKDPACDLILAGAEQWAIRTAWVPGPSDA